ncbi:hypothetical protein CDO28_18540 [Sinorhizobium meliloti]|uniref:hypothetical protein n=1 Tax=Rhizobium meliloti TaxID=382 RepID=UPI000B4A1B9C|nr:hypothetical protein [Sinorhizobium meliloti]ASP73346.1 hypothetical protein CDO28_18540 [Sinorhizobium meliloti]MDE3854463.1 hypothetical protein [Sinorhizobium meliloti]MQW52822.1 hypothetical protein [Sinorhizobium meliloti]
MIRFRRVTLEPLERWLAGQLLPLPGPRNRYRLRVWREVNHEFSALRDELIAYAQEALDDARRRIRKGFEDTLSPFSDPADDPAANYPAMLNRITLQGYLGETLAGLAVEHFGAFGANDWQVPAYLFRFHDQEFQHLDLINERLLMGEPHDRDAERERRPGRTGDDAIAFRIDDQGTITHVLTLEAKCLTVSNTAVIEDAYAKLSAGQRRPSGIRELITLLSDYDTPEAEQWVLRLLEFHRQGFRTVRRRDGLCYTVGNAPKRPAHRIAWLPDAAPHPAYVANRRLEAMEFQLEELEGLVDILYRGS